MCDVAMLQSPSPSLRLLGMPMNSSTSALPAVPDSAARLDSFTRKSTVFSSSGFHFSSGSALWASNKSKYVASLGVNTMPSLPVRHHTTMAPTHVGQA